MKITCLTAENVKRLKAVQIKPNGEMVVVGGDNEAGKSSVLDSIMYALSGKKALPEKPIREGEEEAEIVVDLDDLKVTRTFTAKGTYLKVENGDGASFKSPQAILDKLTGALSFDPLDFSRQDSKKQVEVLRDLVGLDFTELNEKRTVLYEKRTDINREYKKLRARLDDMPQHDDAPDDPVSVSDLTDELKRRQKVNRENQSFRVGINDQKEEVERKESACKEISSEIEKAQQRLQELQKEMKDNQDALDNRKTDLEKATQKAETLIDEDTEEVIEQIRNAEAVNEKVRQNHDRASLLKEVEEEEANAKNLTKQIEDVDAEKETLLANAGFPVEGLSFNEYGVTLNGIPFNQISSGKQLRTSVAIGMAMNPKLRVLLIREGSLLDDKNLQAISEMAAENDAQVWVERVGKGKKASVIIEDGMVVGEAS